MPTIDKAQITGMVLAGGRGSRMGGVDKGLQGFRGMPLAMHALFRLQPQVGEMMINANRNLAAYESMGVPVWPDALPSTPALWPASSPASSAARRLTWWSCPATRRSSRRPGRAAGGGVRRRGTEIAVAATREGGVLQAQPVFCMMRTTVMESLVRFTHEGQRKIDRWTALHATRLVEFADADAFANANTADELRQLQRHD
jgi:molybdopterin-guanine dinucleotide biosynthesis protein A